MKKDSIVKLAYDAWIVETNELFDTTDEELAKKEEIYTENVKYQPQALIIGAKTVVKGLDDALLDAELEKEYELEIPPEDAYGVRDPKLVELHTKREIMRLPEFRKGDKDPMVGMTINMKGKMGTISAITAGRIRVDFNNKLAGRTLKYKYKITSEAESLDDKITYILEIHYGTSENFETKIEKDTADIIIPDMCKYDQRWYLVKHRIATDLQNFTDIKNIRFTEEYKKKEETAEKDQEKGDEVSVKTEDKETKDEVSISIDQEVPEEAEEEKKEE